MKFLLAALLASVGLTACQTTGQQSLTIAEQAEQAAAICAAFGIPKGPGYLDCLSLVAEMNADRRAEEFNRSMLLLGTAGTLMQQSAPRVIAPAPTTTNCTSRPLV